VGIAALSFARSLTSAVPARRRPFALVLLGVFAAGLAALMLVVLSTGSGVTRAAAQATSGEPSPTPHTDASVPANHVMMIGATPEEPGAPAGSGETWGIGKLGKETTLVRYTSEAGWTLGPRLQGSGGEPLSGFTLEKSTLAGQMTRHGAGVLAGTLAGGGSGSQVLLVRKPGEPFKETPPVPTQGETLKEGEEPLLSKEEALFSSSRAPLITPLDEEGGEAGALVAPVVLGEGARAEKQVLHWDGKRWQSETIDIPEASREEFRVLAIAASSPDNAWLLAQLSSKASYPKGAVALFHRVPAPEEASAWRWQPVQLTAGSSEPEPLALTVPVSEPSDVPFTVPGIGKPPTVTAQILTVTSEGVWIDGERTDIRTGPLASTTLFFKPAGAAHGFVEGSWCQPPAEGVAACQHELPQALASGPGRSIAWANGTRFGQRVITGLAGGTLLSLDGEAFTSILSLGAGGACEQNVCPEEEPGAALGAAFGKPDEGWLGLAALPVQMTAHPIASTLTPWPVAFRHPVLAIAPQPGAPIGSLSSEALAVGELGAVARYKPGAGWLPESLFGPGERVETPRLRAVAWPTASRAYAVGDGGEMWLWRGETGLWERDPATPINFRGNLLGIAFDPGNPARGYAVGSSAVVETAGVLLRYGKTWTQETSLPAQVQNANFTAVAFAGSEAIVAYRTRSSAFSTTETGGIMTNDGSGWQIDQAATALVSSVQGAVPGAIAALPDGGAAFTVINGEGGTRLYEREGAGASWQAAPTPPPTEFSGALALFREGGALRALISNAGGVGAGTEPQAPPPGFPPSFLPPLSPGGSATLGGDLIRQTPTGWSDEDHEVNPIGPPLGKYAVYDLPYRPDSTQAMLVNPSGGEEGWAIGGNMGNGGNQSALLETADIERYQHGGSGAVAPLGVGSSQVPVDAGGESAVFAVGGGAQCGAPCAERARDSIGPDVWLAAALERAKQIGVRAFLYTGPHVTTGLTNGNKSAVIPFAQEYASYADILAAAPLPTYAALSPEDLDARPEFNGDEADFERAFTGFPAPFGKSAAALELAEAPEGGLPEGERDKCAAEVGCEAGYYAIDSGGPSGTVRVIVLDDSLDVDTTQLSWLARQLSGAAGAHIPAIVIGNANLNAEIQAGDTQAVEVARVLGQAEACASAYFYDSPEVNVT